MTENKTKPLVLPNSMGHLGVTITVLFPRTKLALECFGILSITLLFRTQNKIVEVSIIFFLCEQGFYQPYSFLKTYYYVLVM